MITTRQSHPQFNGLFPSKKQKKKPPELKYLFRKAPSKDLLELERTLEKLAKENKKNKSFREFFYILFASITLTIGGTGYSYLTDLEKYEAALESLKAASIQSTYEPRFFNERTHIIHLGSRDLLKELPSSMLGGDNTILLSSYARPAVVAIHPKKPKASQNQETQSQVNPTENKSKQLPLNGSGFILDDDRISGEGLIVTNAHVLGEAMEVDVVLINGQYATGKVVGKNTEKDIALIQVNPKDYQIKNLPGLELALVDPFDHKVAADGEQVMAIGHPKGFSWTHSFGMISSNDRKTEFGTQMLQTDATILGGNSGGPLVNMRGKAIGMNTSNSPSSHNLSFAISAGEIYTTVQKILSNKNE